MATITYSNLQSTVGKGGRNLSTDVLIVQSKLNKFSLAPLRALKEDGIAGKLTVASIEAFQARYAGISQPDGRVDPGGRTLQALMKSPMGSVPAIAGNPPSKAAGQQPQQIQIYGKQLDQEGFRVLSEILESAGLSKAEVTSVARDAHEQAVAMYDNCKRKGTAHQYKTYGSAGDQVIDVYVKNSTKLRHEIIALMEAKITELGPEKVSHHASNDAIVFDIGKSSLSGNHLKFLKAAKKHPKTNGAKTIYENDCVHVEIPILDLQPI